MISPAKYWVEPNLTGYMPCTTYWNQFTKCEEGQTTENAVVLNLKVKLKEILEEAKQDYKKLTELVMVLNHKCWAHHNKGQNKIGQYYSDQFLKIQNWGYNHLKGEQLSYFINTLD